MVWRDKDNLHNPSQKCSVIFCGRLGISVDQRSAGNWKCSEMCDDYHSGSTLLHNSIALWPSIVFLGFYDLAFLCNLASGHYTCYLLEKFKLV